MFHSVEVSSIHTAPYAVSSFSSYVEIVSLTDYRNNGVCLISLEIAYNFIKDKNFKSEKKTYLTEQKPNVCLMLLHQVIIS